MPPKPKITKEMILNTVLTLTREAGVETVNARSIAGRLQCSTRPIFTCYENMDELKKEFLDAAFDYYDQYVSDYSRSVRVRPYLILPLSYIEFAREEPHLFQFLFVSDMELAMKEGKDFYKEMDNEKKAEIFSETIGLELETAKGIFLDLFLYAHGIAVLTASGKVSFSQERAEKMFENLVSALIKQKKPDWNWM